MRLSAPKGRRSSLEGSGHGPSCPLGCPKWVPSTCLRGPCTGQLAGPGGGSCLPGSETCWAAGSPDSQHGGTGWTWEASGAASPACPPAGTIQRRGRRRAALKKVPCWRAQPKQLPAAAVAAAVAAAAGVEVAVVVAAVVGAAVTGVAAVAATGAPAAALAAAVAVAAVQEGTLVSGGGP